MWLIVQLSSGVARLGMDLKQKKSTAESVVPPPYNSLPSVSLPVIWSTLSWHHLADDSGIPISNYKQDFGSIRVAW